MSLFVGHNVMHDWAYYLGFDEAHWNAQQYNNGVTANAPNPPPGGPVLQPLGNDGLIGNAQSGAASGSRDNANMSTGADGAHPTTNQFVWQPLAGSFYAPCVDGAYDFAVFGHEYGHLIENRMIGKGVGARQGTHAGSMGEAFGDFDALAAFNELHLPVPAGADRYTEGAYATGNGYNGIRDFLAGRPMGGEFPEPGQNPDTDPLNYGDFGFDIVGTEVHADGEIWVAVQMRLRELFLARTPSPAAATDIDLRARRRSPHRVPGRPALDPGLLRRDGDHAARHDDDPGARRDAGRRPGPLRRRQPGRHLAGLRDARLRPARQNTVSNGDANPVPDFSSPRGSTTRRSSSSPTRRKAATVPVNAQIFVGDYSAGVDADRGHQPRDDRDRDERDRQPRQHGPVRANGAGLAAVGKPRERWNYYNFVAGPPATGTSASR